MATIRRGCRLERPSKTFSFGPFELRTRSQELYKRGIKLKLRPQPFRILNELLCRCGELVTREELRDELWSSETFVDFEQSLNTSIKELRAALGDSATEPRYVETVPRLGYRFIARAEVINGFGSKRDADLGRISSSGSEAVQRSEQPIQTRYVVLAACAALLVAALVANHYWSPSNTLPGPAKITQISQWNRAMNGAVLSPDGHAVAFNSPISGIEQVFLMLTSGGEPLQLTNDEGEKSVDNFASDSKEIYYGRGTVGGDEVWAVPALGGSPRRVTSAWYVLPSLDGAFIYYDRTDRPGIFRAEKSGLNEELVYSPSDSNLQYFPALFFPDGKELLAVGAPRDLGNIRTFFKINLTSHEAVDLGEVTRNADAVWAEPGKTLLFSRTINGLTNIWQYKLKDRRLTQITFGTGPDYSPMQDPGGKGIYYVNGRSTGLLSAYHVHSKESTDIASVEATQPAISPDGKHVMYVTLPGPERSELWVSDLYGGKQVKLATGVGLATGVWASDDFHLAYIETGTGDASRVFIVAADGSGLRQLPATGGTTVTAIFGPNQKSVYVSVLDKVGSMATIWKWTVGSSKMEKLVENCGQASDIDAGGQYLLANVLRGAEMGIYEVSISDKTCRSLLPGVPTFAEIFARDGGSILYALASNGDVTIYRQPWKNGKAIDEPQIALKVPFAFPLEYEGNGNAYDFSRDLSTIVYARPGGHADLYLLSQK
jgi:DNA-binding winged helix-turn-helix (wHTH) protein/Tol biopolymer transport system component